MSAPPYPPPGPSGDGLPAAPGEPTRAASVVPTPVPSAGAPLPPDPLAGRDQPTEPRRRPWGWIVVCALLAVVAVGVTIWALSLNSDLNDQRDQTAAAQQQANKASSEVDQLTSDVNDALDQAGQAGAAAKDELQRALADLKAGLGALAEESKPPAEGSGTPEAAATPTAPATGSGSGTATPAENATPEGG